jgi:hypothetical protein
MKNIKLHASPHPAESAAACPEVWDAEGDSWDLAGRRSSNLRRQNLRRPAEHRRHPAVGRCRPVFRLLLDKVVLLCRLLCLDLLYLVRRPPPPQPTAHHICPTTSIKSKQISTYKKMYLKIGVK